MTRVEQLAAFVVRVTYEDLSEEARRELKIRVLDALGCAIGAIEGPPIRMLRAQLEDFGGTPLVTLIGGGKTAPDRAAFYNSALVRYLDYNDSYLASKETCHPSDNLGSVLAASEYARRSGKAFLTALAVAYQVQCRLSDVAPVRAKGFDHTTQGAYAVAAGSESAGPHPGANRSCHRDQRHSQQCPACYPYRAAFTLEGPGLSQHGMQCHPRDFPPCPAKWVHSSSSPKISQSLEIPSSSACPTTSVRKAHPLPFPCFWLFEMHDVLCG